MLMMISSLCEWSDELVMAVDATSAQPQILPDIIAILKTITIAIIMTRKMMRLLKFTSGCF